MSSESVNSMSTKENLNANLGGNGFDIITTGTVTGNWCAVAPIDGASATLTATATNSDAITSLDIYGTIVGHFTSITQVAGTLIAYKI